MYFFFIFATLFVQSHQLFFQNQSWIENHSSSGKRNLMHIELQSSQLHGNSSSLRYFYVNAYFGSNKQPQSLIVDTGSYMTAVPCKQGCTAKTCGEYVFPWFDGQASETHFVFECSKYRCKCNSDMETCRFYQGYMEGSAYSGYMVRD